MPGTAAMFCQPNFGENLTKTSNLLHNWQITIILCKIKPLFFVNITVPTVHFDKF